MDLQKTYSHLGQPGIPAVRGLKALLLQFWEDYSDRQMESASAQRPIIVPSDVFVETVNTLGKRAGHETALQAADELLRPGSQFVLIETTSHIEAALEKFKNQSQAVSLTDCIVMTVADHYGTKEIFGFYKQFEDV